jgi:heme A synthase
MRVGYKALAYAIAVDVAIQAALIVLAIGGLVKWVNDGNVFDKSVMETQDAPFPEAIGIPLHSLNGSVVIPVLALLLVIFSFFARVRGATRWALLVLALVLVQGTLGFLGHELPAVGSLHGINALLLFGTAVHAGRRAGARAAEPAAEALEPVADRV